MKNGYAALLLVGILTGTAVQAHADLIMDPGFEGGTPNSYTGTIGDGWVVTAGTGAICNNNHAGCGNVGLAHTGVQMAFLDWSSTLNTITQTLPTVIGQDYTISYWVEDSRSNFLSVVFGGSTLFSGTAPNGSSYVEYTFDAKATSTSTVLAFSGRRSADGGGTLLDDVSVIPSSVPEPSSWLLTATALFGLSWGALRRRRQ